MKNILLLHLAKKMYLRKYILPLLIGVCISQFAISQDMVKAKINTNGQILLPVSDQVANAYIIDLSELKMKSDDEMIEFLRNKSNDLYMLRARGNATEAVLVLKKEEHPTWKPEQWRTTIEKESSKTPLKR